MMQGEMTPWASFSVSSNLNGAISKAWGSYRENKEPILKEMSQEEGETKNQAKIK